MFICLVIAILATFLWIDQMVIESINARINPYQKTVDDVKADRVNAVKRTVYILIASIFWSTVFYFGM